MINQKSSIISIVITLVIVGFFGTQLPKLEFDYELENFFPIGDEDLAYYNQFAEKFGNDNDYLLIGLKGDSGIFDSTFMQTTLALIDDLKSIPGTTNILSLPQLEKVVKSPMGYVEIPYLHFDSQAKLKQDSIKIQRETDLRESFISKDGLSMKLMLLHKRFSKEDSDAYAEKLDDTIAKHEFDAVYTAGKAVAQKAFVSAVEKDFTKFLIGAMIMIFIMLIVFVRKLPLIITALVVSGMSLVSTIGIMVLLGKKFDVMSSLIPSILLVVSMSNIVHLFAKVQEEWNEAGCLQTAIKLAVKDVGIATFLTSTTTALGFLTLITINVIPIIDFGLYTAGGILLTFVITYLIFPQMLTLTNPDLSVKTSHFVFQRTLIAVFQHVIRKRRNIFAGFAFAVFLVGLGIGLLQINAFLIDDLPKDDPVKESFQYFDEQYAGSKPFSLSVWPKDSALGVYEAGFITELDKIESIAKEELNAGSLVSPVTYVKSINQTLNGGVSHEYQLPETTRAWKKVLRTVKKINPEEKYIQVTSPNEAQVSGFTRDLGSQDAMRRNEIFLKRLEAEIDHGIIGYQMTGTSLLIEKSHELLSMNLIKGLILAILIVGGIAGLMFRSIKMILITLVPNLFPILAIAAIMGYAGIPINLSTSIIFAISFGIVVDDTIHFLSKFKAEKAKGLKHIYAIKRTMLSTGEPIIITTIILTAGFAVFCFSQFGATFYTGLFVSVSFIVALIADLTLLPVLILMFLPDKNKK